MQDFGPSQSKYQWCWGNVSKLALCADPADAITHLQDDRARPTTVWTWWGQQRMLLCLQVLCVLFDHDFITRGCVAQFRRSRLYSQWWMIFLQATRLRPLPLLPTPAQDSEVCSFCHQGLQRGGGTGEVLVNLRNPWCCVQWRKIVAETTICVSVLNLHVIVPPCRFVMWFQRGVWVKWESSFGRTPLTLCTRLRCCEMSFMLTSQVHILPFM